MGFPTPIGTRCSTWPAAAEFGFLPNRVRRFLYDSVLADEYKGLSVKL